MIQLMIVGTGCLATGLAMGMYLGYLMARTLLDLNNDLSNKIYMMKRQGFVPQFEFEQRNLDDPSQSVTEY